MKLITALTLGLFVAGCDDAYAGFSYTKDNNATGNTTRAASSSVVKAANGMTLYTFDKDAAGQSNCYGDCATSWPPYLATAGAKSPGKGLSIIKRSDGTRQWAKDDAPLYLWVGDTKPGDTNGDGVGGVWHIAR